MKKHEKLATKNNCLSYKEQIFIQSFYSEVSNNYVDASYGLKHLATAMAMSERQLHRKCYEYLKINPGLFLRKFRLTNALLLIERGEAICNAALAVGFSTHSSFCYSFKNHFGYSPSDLVKTLNGSCF